MGCKVVRFYCDKTITPNAAVLWEAHIKTHAHFTYSVSVKVHTGIARPHGGEDSHISARCREGLVKLAVDTGANSVYYTSAFCSFQNDQLCLQHYPRLVNGPSCLSCKLSSL